MQGVLISDSRDDVTRTRDSYVPNVVRYQLRYTPLLSLKINNLAIFDLFFDLKLVEHWLNILNESPFNPPQYH